jgi:phage terminase large subunit-like protein
VYSSSAGQEAVELAASAGLVLDPWQADILTASLGERPDGQWSAFEVGVIVSRQNGKGALLEARELAGLLLFGERLIMHTAHELKTAMEAFRRVESLFLNSDDLRRRVKKVSHANGDEGIELVNGARLRFVARSKGSGRGFSGDLVVLDEAYALTDEQIEALMPTMSARPNPQIWYTTSPPLDAISCPHLFRVRKRGLAAADGLAYFDFGCPSDVDLDDREAWSAANPALGIRITPEFVQRERESMSDAGFARERLGVWPDPDESSGPINLKTWSELADATSKPGEDLAFAIDVSPSRDVASIALYGLRADGLGHVELVEHRSGTEWIVGRLHELKHRWNPVAIGLDLKGPAGSLLLDLEKNGIIRPEELDKPKRGQLAIPHSSDVAAACGQLADAVTQRTERHIDQPPLTAAVGAVKTRPLGDAWAWGRKHSTSDISPLYAATLARWAYLTRVDAVREDYDPLMNIF